MLSQKEKIRQVLRIVNKNIEEGKIKDMDQSKKSKSNYELLEQLNREILEDD